MSNILYITASIRSEADSVSRGLGQRIVDGLAAKTGAAVTTRDLAANDLPFVSAERFGANLTAPEARTAEQAELAALADTLIAELQAAETIVIAAPVYNFGPPATLKAWADLVARRLQRQRRDAGGQRFRFHEPVADLLPRLPRHQRHRNGLCRRDHGRRRRGEDRRGAGNGGEAGGVIKRPLLSSGAEGSAVSEAMFPTMVGLR